MAALADRLTFTEQPTVEEKLTLPEFQAKYGHDDSAYEYWHGKAIPKAMPTWMHGLLQVIVAQLLTEAGYLAGGDVELRIVPDARPRPDIAATSSAIEEPYPTKPVDVVVEILSKDDRMLYVLEKCEAYRSWGCEYIYVVNPDRRQLFRWTETGLELSEKLTSVPAARIWTAVDEALSRKK